MWLSRGKRKETTRATRGLGFKQWKRKWKITVGVTTILEKKLETNNRGYIRTVQGLYGDVASNNGESDEKENGI